MPIHIETDDKVLIATLTGRVRTQDIETMYKASVQYLHETGLERLYRITDAREVESSFFEVLEILKTVGKHAHSDAYQKVTPVIVGTSEWVRLVQEGMRHQQFGAINIPVVTTMGEAYAFIRVAMQDG